MYNISFYKKPFGLILLLLSMVSANAQITSNSFASRVDFGTGNPSLPVDVYVGDLDGDNKPDLVSANQALNTITAFRNLTTTGVINSFSFNNAGSFVTAAGPTSIYGDDIDGDGKIDLFVSNFSANSISVFRNTSSLGSINFATRIDYAVGVNSGPIITADLNGDGIKEVINSNFGNNTISIHRNLSTSGSVLLQTPRIDIAASGTANQARELIADDLDGDGKVDLAVVYYNGFVSLFRNTSTLTTISFASSVNLLGVNLNAGISSGDIDNDGKKDLVVSSYNSGLLLVYKNNSTVGSLSFSAFTSFNTGASNNQPHGNALIDIDNDGRLDLAFTRRNASSVSFFRNFGTTGTINSNTFANRIDYPTSTDPIMVRFVDVDGDNKPDMITNNSGGNQLSVFKNQSTASTGLIAWYPFNGNAGDSSGFGNHGTVVGATLTSDRNGNPNLAYNFNGSGHVINIPTSSSLRPQNRITIATWIRPEAKLTAGWNILLTYRNSNSATPFNSYAIATFSGAPYINRWAFMLSSSLNNLDNEVTTKNSKMDNIWHHMATVYDGQKMMIYINGVLDSAVNINLGNIVYNNISFSIGNYTPVANTNYTGSIDDLRIYDRALSANEIRALAGLDTSIVYYSKSSGNLNQLSTWGTNTDGSGTSPLSFDSTRVTYRVQNNASPTIGGTWRLGSNSTVVLGDGTNSFNLFMSSMDSLFADSIHLNNTITVTVGGHLATTKLTAQPGTTVQYISASSQILAAGTYENLVVSGSTKQLSANTIVSNNLAMVASINCATFNLTLGTSSTNRGTLNRSAGTIIGAFSRWFNNTTNTSTTGLFPVGTATRYAPVTVEFTTAPTAGGRVTVDFVNTNPGNIGLPLVDFGFGFVFIDKAANDGFWRITNSTITGGTFSLSLVANNFAGVTDFTLLRTIRRNSGGAWSLQGNPITPTGSNVAATVVRTSLTSINGEYTVGGDQSINPLPVKWGPIFVRKSASDVIDVSWVTLQEINADKFIVQRSSDGKTWENRGEIKAVGNSLVKNNYRFNDAINTNDPVYFYRIKQFEVSGDYDYSKVVSIQLNGELNTEQEFTIYPNPANQSVFVTGLTGVAIIFDITGKQIMEINHNGYADISNLRPGIYFIRSNEKSIRLVKQ
ncbi:MAG: FG-GAP-like repeat-containing protein [Bacteroidia bacterium]|jgi:hypothetical protein|nr:FG-GAP-like repeat-containing protein [Bacteroidia bacterium]